jgi:hypothetical protein
LLKDYISNERFEMEREKIARDQEKERLSGRFGTNILGEGASEEELLAYATMLSEEAFSSDEIKRKTSEHPSSTASPSLPPSRKEYGLADAVDADLEEALRLSLLETEQMSTSPVPSDFDIPIRYAKESRRGTPSRHATPGSSNVKTLTPENDDDLEFALQLSLAEEQSRTAADDEFPAFAFSSSPGSEGSGKGKGKGKSRRR